MTKIPENTFKILNTQNKFIFPNKTKAQNNEKLKNLTNNYKALLNCGVYEVFTLLYIQRNLYKLTLLSPNIMLREHYAVTCNID